MAQVLLKSKTTGQRVYADPNTADYTGYLQGGFEVVQPETAPQAAAGATPSQVLLTAPPTTMGGERPANVPTSAPALPPSPFYGTPASETSKLTEAQAAAQLPPVQASIFGENSWAVPMIQKEFQNQYGRQPSQTEITQVVNSGNIKYDSASDWLNRAGFTGQKEDPKATLYNSTGGKQVVTVGSDTASQLLSQGWTLQPQKTESNILTSNDLSPTSEINLNAGTPTGNIPGSMADQTAAGAKATLKTAQQQIEEYMALLQPAQESGLSQQVSKLMGEVGTAAEGLIGRGERQLEAEKQAGIAELKNSLSEKTASLSEKLAEIDALTASYQAANAGEELRPQTLSRLSGAQAANYRQYIAQKNLLSADAALIQTQVNGLAGRLSTAQENANRVVDLLYQDRESSYNAKLTQLNILMPQLEKEEARYAAAVKMYVEQQQTALATQKAEKKQVLDVMLEAIKSGIKSSTVLDQIAKAGTVAEAMQIYGENKPVSSEYQFVAGTENQPGGVFDKATGTFTATAGGVITDASGNAYNIASYASDPNHEIAVQSILNRIGKMDSVGQMDSYIQQVAPGSQVTGQMVANASQKYGVSWESILAIMQQDSNFADPRIDKNGVRQNYIVTGNERQAAVKSLNPGNVGNTEIATSTGQLVNQGNWQAGVDAVAKNLAGRKVTKKEDNLSPAQMNTTINSIVSSFDNEQIVKDFNTAKGGYETLQKIGVNTKSPADDIAFIYAFAKIMDPNSVVREGEYNTVQKYAQTWAENFGFKAQRIFSNTNFLSSDAKQKMLNALKPKIDTITEQYQNLYNEYQNRIEAVQGGGFNSLQDYSEAFTNQPNQSVQSTESILPLHQGFWSKVGNWLFGE